MQTTLLIIDDNPFDIHTLVEILRNQGFRLIVVLNGDEGFNKAIAVQPALILLDRIKYSFKLLILLSAGVQNMFCTPVFEL